MEENQSADCPTINDRTFGLGRRGQMSSLYADIPESQSKTETQQPKSKTADACARHGETASAAATSSVDIAAALQRIRPAMLKPSKCRKAAELCKKIANAHLDASSSDDFFEFLRALLEESTVAAHDVAVHRALGTAWESVKPKTICFTDDQRRYIDLFELQFEAHDKLVTDDTYQFVRACKPFQSVRPQPHGQRHRITPHSLRTHYEKLRVTIRITF